jgi:hypothetical protein
VGSTDLREHHGDGTDRFGSEKEQGVTTGSMSRLGAFAKSERMVDQENLADNGGVLPVGKSVPGMMLARVGRTATRDTPDSVSIFTY